MSNIKILIASHKRADLPSDSIYLPVRVAAELNNDNFGYQPDNEGENISIKNPYFCELTAIYWAWKNLESDFVGLSHYRRFFSWKRKSKSKFDRILSSDEVQELCSKYDVILPAKRRYYIESLYSHYAHTHDNKHLDIAREIIREKYPDYLSSFDSVMKRTSGHMFNMLIMKTQIFHDYCEWMFSILFDLEKQVDVSGLSAFDARLFGRVSELLLDVWITKNNIEYKEIGFVQLGDENWGSKIKGFLKAKFFGRKYNQSK